MKLLVVGASGQVAQLLAGLDGRSAAVAAVGRPHLDLETPASIVKVIERSKPDVVVNTAAYTAVDRAESEPIAARRVNADGAGALARACAANGIPLIHLSTDCVFSGEKPSPYEENDPTGPLGVYGTTKLEGERLVAASQPRHVILRTSWIYSDIGPNFVRGILRRARAESEIDVVNDQVGCPTDGALLAEAITTIARRLRAEESTMLCGIFHAVGSGSCSRSEFADAIIAASSARGGPVAKVKSVPTHARPILARRPANARLDPGKLERVYSIRMPAWRVSLETCMDRIAASGFALD